MLRLFLFTLKTSARIPSFSLIDIHFEEEIKVIAASCLSATALYCDSYYWEDWIITLELTEIKS